MVTTDTRRTGQGVTPVCVAAYGRVPGHRDALFKEKATLIQRFSEIIQQNGNWEYSGVFIDSGTGHDQLDVLLSRCREGAVNTIITASMNTLSLRREELYRTLSELKDLGVGIDFIDEDLSTTGEGGDELLSTLASFSKPEKPKKPPFVPYGIGDEEEIAVVQRIFSLFLSGHGRSPIAEQLNADCVPPPHSDLKKDGSAWTYCDIRRILADPVYAKEGLIDEQTWSRTQAEASRRNSAYGRRPPAASPLRDLNTCGVCGNHFTRRERGRSSLWLCKTYLRGSRSACPSRCIREAMLLDIINEVTGGVGDVDNITVYPDGSLVINTSTGEYERKWGNAQ